MRLIAYCWKCGVSIWSSSTYHRDDAGFYTCRDCMDDAKLEAIEA